MAVRKIYTFPDPVLKEESVEVEVVDEETRRLVADMIETMYNAAGIGLAAPQVGVLKRVIVVDIPKSENSEGEEAGVDDDMVEDQGPIVLINPVISKEDGTVCFEEGCLSVPELLVKVKRARSITVCGLDENGGKVEYICAGLSAVAIQHEMDHLKGVLITDYASHLKRVFYIKRIKKQEKANKL